MYMRFVQIKVRPDQLASFQKLYESRILPALQDTDGCLHADLTQSETHADECISITLWDNQQHADAYEKSGLFQKLVDEAAPYLSDASEWRIQLSEDLTLEYKPVKEEPVVQGFTVEATTGPQGVSASTVPRMHMRIVSAKIQPGKFDLLRKLYADEIIPALRTVEGCRYAYLVEGIREKDEAISITVWDTKEDAERYEKSGRFEQLLEKTRHTFSSLYQWKMSLEGEKQGKAVTSDDLKVMRYHIVTGQRFPERQNRRDDG